MGMTCHKYVFILGRTPVIHVHIMKCFQVIVCGRTIDIDFKKILQRSPDITHKPFTENIAVTLFVTLMTMCTKNVQEAADENSPGSHTRKYADDFTVNFFQPIGGQRDHCPRRDHDYQILCNTHLF